MSDGVLTARVHITLKSGVVDPQGNAIDQALNALGFSSIAGVRIGRTVEVDLSGRTAEEATKDVSAMCDRLLANPVIEDYRIEILPSP